MNDFIPWIRNQKSDLVPIIYRLMANILVLQAKRKEKWCFKNNSPYIPPEIQVRDNGKKI
jgi:hypothetical protein